MCIRKNVAADELPWIKWQEIVSLREPKRKRIKSLSRLKATVKLIEEKIPKCRVLDLGCQYGILSEHLRKKGYDVYSLDVGSVIKESKKMFPKLKTLNGTAFNIPVKNGFFDAILAFEIIEHIIDLDKFFGEIRRVLKNDGVLLVSTPNMANYLNITNLLMGNTDGFQYQHQPVSHIRYFTINTLYRALKRYKFKPVECIRTCEVNLFNLKETCVREGLNPDVEPLKSRLDALENIKNQMIKSFPEARISDMLFISKKVK